MTEQDGMMGHKHCGRVRIKQIEIQILLNLHSHAKEHVQIYMGLKVFNTDFQENVIVALAEKNLFSLKELVKNVLLKTEQSLHGLKMV